MYTHVKFEHVLALGCEYTRANHATHLDISHAIQTMSALQGHPWLQSSGNLTAAGQQALAIVSLTLATPCEKSSSCLLCMAVQDCLSTMCPTTSLLEVTHLQPKPRAGCLIPIDVSHWGSLRPSRHHLRHLQARVQHGAHDAGVLTQARHALCACILGLRLGCLWSPAGVSRMPLQLSSLLPGSLGSLGLPGELLGRGGGIPQERCRPCYAAPGPLQ